MPPPNSAALFKLYVFLARALVYVFGVVLGVCGPASPLSLSLSLSLSVYLSLWLHPAKAMAAVLVKRFVYPIRMMKRPFISTLPPARR